MEMTENRKRELLESRERKEVNEDNRKVKLMTEDEMEVFVFKTLKVIATDNKVSIKRAFRMQSTARAKIQDKWKHEEEATRKKLQRTA